MAEGQTKTLVWCNICELKGDDKSASFWCFECDQFFCDDCKVHHGFSRPLKDHCAISMDNYNALPHYIRSLTSHCTEHDKVLELFCPDHNEPCCLMCTSGAHGTCKGLFPISKIVKTSTKEDLYSDHYRIIDEMSKYILRLQEERKGSLSNFNQQIQECAKEFKRIRQEMNAIFDELETKMLNSLKTSFGLYSNESKKIMENLQKEEKKVLDIKNETDMLLQHASTFHVFIARTELQRMVKELEEAVQIYPSECSLEGVDAQTLCSFDARSLFEDMNLENTLKTVRIPSAVEYVAEKSKHAQLSKTVPKTLDTLVLQPTGLSVNFSGRDCNIVGCSIRESGEYVFCDFSKNSRIVIFRGNGVFERVIKTKGKPCCLAFMDNTKLAVTFPHENKVKIIDYFSGSVLAETDMKTKCVGIGISRDNIVVAGGVNLYILDFNGKLLKVISIKELKLDSASHVQCDDNHFVVSSYVKMCCLHSDLSLSKQYTFDENIHIDGINTDSDNNIYTSCYKSHRIILKSENGDLERVLLTGDDGLSKPTGLCYDRKRNQMLAVTNSNKCAVVYDLKCLKY